MRNKGAGVGTERVTRGISAFAMMYAVLFFVDVVLFGGSRSGGKVPDLRGYKKYSYVLILFTIFDNVNQGYFGNYIILRETGEESMADRYM